MRTFSFSLLQKRLNRVMCGSILLVGVGGLMISESITHVIIIQIDRENKFSVDLLLSYIEIIPRPLKTDEMRMSTMHTGATYFITTVKSFLALNAPPISASSIIAFGLMI